MSATIYEQTPGGLYAQPGRAVTTFPSGLVRVDQTYICATPDAATHRSTLAVGNAMPDGDSTPALEALAIYPEPQEINRGDGFTEFRVSAYGRTASGFRGIQLTQQISLGTSITATTPTATIADIYGTFWEITGIIVMPFGTPVTVADLEYDETLSEPLSFQKTLRGPLLTPVRIDEDTYSVDLGFVEQSTVTLSEISLTINSQTNFGAYVEISVTIGRGINTILVS